MFNQLPVINFQMISVLMCFFLLTIHNRFIALISVFIISVIYKIKSKRKQCLFINVACGASTMRIQNDFLIKDEGNKQTTTTTTTPKKDITLDRLMKTCDKIFWVKMRLVFNLTWFCTAPLNVVRRFILCSVTLKTKACPS